MQYDHASLSNCGMKHWFNKKFEDEMLLSVAALWRGKFAYVRCPSPGSPGNDQSKDNKKYKV